MRETFRTIAKNLKELGITGPIIFTGSAVLKAYQLLDREIADIDIILENSIKNQHKLESLKKIFGIKQSEEYQGGNHTTLYFANNSLHLDIFLEDTSKIEVFKCLEDCVDEDFYTATPKHIISKKLSYGRDKDKKDWREIQLNALDILVSNKYSI